MAETYTPTYMNVIGDFRDPNNMSKMNSEHLQDVRNLPNSYLEYLVNNTLDPAIQEHQAQFVQNVDNYYTGPSFSENELNTDNLSWNFIGVNRIGYTPIGDSARYIPDVDTTVFKQASAHNVRFGQGQTCGFAGSGKPATSCAVGKY
jgi:hypothetical protein